MDRDRSATTILVVDDDTATCNALKRALEGEGYSVITCPSAVDALKALDEREVQLIITDVVMKGMTGIALLERVHKRSPELPVLVCTGYGTIEAAVDAMRKGATDYLAKPINLDALTLAVRRALTTAALKADNRSLRDQLIRRHSFHEAIGRSPSMLAVFERVRTIAPVDVTILLRGESGTGKEVIARAIHAASSRADRPLVTVDCAAIAETLIESELFGHERGSFTGATRQKKGKIELADRATLFLDEIGDLSPTAQTKLLRVLQEHTFERVGGIKEISVDVRMIAATNRKLEQMIDEGTFRQDLYYRLNVVAVELPPLRERREDIELLARHFLAEFAQTHQRKPRVLHRAARNLMLAYQWPGNVRELRNLCENLTVTTRDEVITPTHLPAAIRAETGKPGASLLDGSHPLREIERHVIFQTLSSTEGNKVEAARILGIGLKTLYRRLEEYGE